MANTVRYSDPRFGVEKILRFKLTDLSGADDLEVGRFIMTEDIIVTELGIDIQQTLTTSGDVTLTVEESAAACAAVTLTVNSAAAIATVERQTTMTDDDCIDNGNTLRLYISSGGATAGAGYPYVKYRARFAT